MGNLNLMKDFPSFESLKHNISPELERDLKTFYEESRFGLNLILADLPENHKKYSVLEIGSGIGLLSCFLASKGFEVTAIEPSAPGFGVMRDLQNHIMHFFHTESMKLKFIDQAIEEYNSNKKFNYIFSINVLEHMKDPILGLTRTRKLLEPDGVARFISPNYQIPYEPHFNIPIIINKSITYSIFRRHINSYNCHDPSGLWESLNWITLDLIRREMSVEKIKIGFSKKALMLYFERMDSDPQFLARKGRLFICLAKLSKKVCELIPMKFNPIIDVSLFAE